VDISFFGAIGVAAQTDGVAEAVGEFFLGHGSCALDFWELLWIIA
jgi:hypothetical protein